MNIVLKICVFAGTALLGAVCGGFAVSKMNKANNTPTEQPSAENTAAENTVDTPSSSEATE